MADKEPAAMFDWSLYGMLVRKHRVEKGYKKAEAFSETIWRRTRVDISRDTLYKIEQGRQIPNAEQFMAINMALFGAPINEELLQLCMSTEWRSISNEEVDTIPDEWKLENTEILYEKLDNGTLLEIDVITASQECDSSRSPQIVMQLIEFIGEDESLFIVE